MEVKINLSKLQYPKLFKIDENKIDETIHRLLTIGYQTVFSSVNEKNLIQNVENICRKFKDDIITGVDSNIRKIDVQDKVEQLNNVLVKMFGISTTSNKKGEISEQLVYNMINDKYPNYSYDIKRHIAHHADGELTSPTGMKCLVEIKNYTHTVNKDEINKFKYDLKTTNNNLGIFISLQTNISGRRLIDYETYDDTHIIYISKIMEDCNKLDCGILLLESIYKLIKKDNIEIKVKQIKQTIYHNFEELENLIFKTNKIRQKYDVLEKNIKENLDKFYLELRNYELEIKEKMKIVWKNLFNELDDIDKDFLDEKDKIIKSVDKKDKCFKILNKLFDLCKNKNINVRQEEKKYILLKNRRNIASIKKMKNKLQINFNEINFSCILLTKEDNSRNFKTIDFLFDSLENNKS